MMLSFWFWVAPPGCGLSTLMPRISMKLVVEMKKMRRNMITSMSGIRFNSIGCSGSDKDRRRLISALSSGEIHFPGSGEFGFVHHSNHQTGHGILVDLDNDR